LNVLLTRKLPTFLSRLNEISGGCEKITVGPNHPSNVSFRLILVSLISSAPNLTGSFRIAAR